MSQETRGAMALRERDVSACRRTSTNRTSSRELLDSPKPQPTGIESLLKELGGARKTSGTKTHLKTFKMETSSVVSRLRSFLPEMQEADHVLKQRLADGTTHPELDIELVTDGQPCIEMDMAVLPMDDLQSSSSSEESESENEVTRCTSRSPPTAQHAGSMDEDIVISAICTDQRCDTDKNMTLRLSPENASCQALVEEVS